MVRHYTLSSEDLALINRRRGDPNRPGFAVMLCYLRFPGRILQQGEQPLSALSSLSNSGSMRRTSAITPNEIKLAESTCLRFNLP
jgi:TnpA family transposase